MPNETDYLEDLSRGLVRLRVRFVADGLAVTSFLAQLEAIHRGEWKAVRRYDDRHGQPHIDILDQWGRERHKIWLELDRKGALTEAIRDLRSNWSAYIAIFVNEKLP